jgi:hypothetical protein
MLSGKRLGQYHLQPAILHANRRKKRCSVRLSDYNQFRGCADGIDAGKLAARLLIAGDRI